jgi:hypothetical protein
MIFIIVILLALKVLWLVPSQVAQDVASFDLLLNLTQRMMRREIAFSSLNYTFYITTAISSARARKVLPTIFAGILRYSKLSLLSLVRTQIMTLQDIHQLTFSVDRVTQFPCLPQSARDMSEFTGSDRALEKARAWLSTCIARHDCSQGTISKLPTRVLIIDGLDQVRLYVSQQGEKASYACLSHCWGSDPLSLLRTTTASLDTFRASVPWKDLPNTFRDAINTDWRHEGSLMAEIYESAYVTLAATKASDPTEGCFATPDDVYRTRTISLPAGLDDDGGKEDHKLHVRSPLDHYILPMLKRGWVRTTLSNWN